MAVRRAFHDQTLPDTVENAQMKIPTIMELVERHQDEWVFYSPAITLDIEEEFDDALEVYYDQRDVDAAERIVREVLCKCPEHIDALHHLSIWTEARGDAVGGFAFCQAAVAVGLRAIPSDFQWNRSKLPWTHLSNRPFLRSYRGLALHAIQRQDWNNAITILSRLLAVDPGDNQGVRHELPGCWLETGNFSAVVYHCHRYRDEESPNIWYSLALALILAERVRDAQQVLLQAICFRPLVAREILADSHPEPNRKYAGAYTADGITEAWDYYNRCGKYWKRSATAMTLLRRLLHQNTH